MATVTRQPFAPLDNARLQSLTSLKNRQNAIAPATGKRKASELNDEDFENVDPGFFSKRSKGSDKAFFPSKDSLKPASYALKTTPSFKPVDSPLSSVRPTATPRSRSLLQSRSPTTKLNTSIVKSSPLSAPAGRSPTRGKRSGLLSSRRRTCGNFSRVDPPSFNIGSAAPFSLDAALQGTISSFEAKPSAPSAPKNTLSSLVEPEMNASWFFDIHEDTPEQEMTNLLQHGTCTLDISSDEECEQKASRERAEGRDKENIPPADDVSQTNSSRRAARRPAEDEMVVEKERAALGEMNVAEFYAPGCDEHSIVIIPGDEDETETVVAEETAERASGIAPQSYEFSPDLPLDPLPETTKTVEELMAQSESSRAAVLEPIEGTGEMFELWESGSTKDDTERAIAVAEEA